MNTPRRTAGQLNKETQKFKDETEQLKEETRQFSDSVTRTHAQITEMYTYLTSDKSASQKTEIDNLYNYLYLAKEGFLSRAKSFQQFIEESARLKIKYLGKKATNDEEEPQPGELKQMENEMKALLQKMQMGLRRVGGGGWGQPSGFLALEFMVHILLSIQRLRWILLFLTTFSIWQFEHL